MLTIAPIWNILAGVAALVALVAVIGVILSLVSLARIRRDQRTVDAAERLERVDLSDVVQRYVPLGLRSQNAAEEIQLVKQQIAHRRPRRVRLAVVLGVLTLATASASLYFVKRNREEAEALRLRPYIRSNVNALTAIQGVWGWKADFAQSCQVNPQAISVSPDRKTVTVDYAHPRDPLQQMKYSVASTPPNGLVLKMLGQTPAGTDDFTVTINFLDENTFLLSNSQYPMASAGSIERCAPGNGVQTPR